LFNYSSKYGKGQYIKQYQYVELFFVCQGSKKMCIAFVAVISGFPGQVYPAPDAGPGNDEKGRE